MLATGDRPRLQLRRLADRAEHAQDDHVLRAQVRPGLSFPLRVVLVFGGFALFPLGSLLARGLPLARASSRARVLRFVSRFCRLLLKVMNIPVTVSDPRAALPRVPGGAPGRGCLLLANHMSYLDVVVIAAHAPAVFVTSREVEETPILGLVSRAAGCIFVERRSRATVHRDIDAITAVLNAGHNVVLFPEGSTSNGERFLEFKRTLLESAIRSRCAVLPLCLRYDRVAGRPFGPANRDRVAWYGPMTFFPHLLGLLRTSSVEASLQVLAAPAFRDHKCRKRLSADIERQLAAAYAVPPAVADLGLLP